MRFALCAALLLIATNEPILAQSPDARSPEAFEVASVKPSRSGSSFSSSLDPALFTCSANSLLVLILSTYPDLSASRVTGGPAWLTTEYWDVVAKLPPNMPKGEKELNRKAELMLQTLLADRFKLQIHREKRDQQVYALIMAKGGPKLKPTRPGIEQFSARYTNGRYEFGHASMEDLAKWLYNPFGTRTAVDRPVIDKTGLQGFFDFALDLTSDTPQAYPAETTPIFTAAIEQLGLSLQPQKSAAEFLIIDHAERPDGN